MNWINLLRVTMFDQYLFLLLVSGVQNNVIDMYTPTKW